MEILFGKPPILIDYILHMPSDVRQFSTGFGAGSHLLHESISGVGYSPDGLYGTVYNGNSDWWE